MALQEQAGLVAELESERAALKEQLVELSSRLESMETQGDTSSSLAQRRLELRTKELESRLELEQTTRARLEVCTTTTTTTTTTASTSTTTTSSSSSSTSWSSFSSSSSAAHPHPPVPPPVLVQAFMFVPGFPFGFFNIIFHRIWLSVSCPIPSLKGQSLILRHVPLGRLTNA